VSQTDGTPALGDTTFSYDGRGNRISDDNLNSLLTNSRRDYTYDGRGNVINVHGKYYTGSTFHAYDVVSAYDARNRRVFKSFLDNVTGVQAQWFFYYDAVDRLTEIRYTPNITSSSTYTLYQLFWIGDRPVLYWQTDFPSNSTTKRYVGTDEMDRPIEMWTWPASGNATRVWAINPSAWGFDKNVLGPTVFQPLLFHGQYQDTETAAMLNDGTNIHRPGVVLNLFRTYDPFIGGYLQTDPLVPHSWTSYGYAWSDPVGKTDPTGLMDTNPAFECMWRCAASPQNQSLSTGDFDTEGMLDCLGDCDWGAMEQVHMYDIVGDNGLWGPYARCIDKNCVPLLAAGGTSEGGTSPRASYSGGSSWPGFPMTSLSPWAGFPMSLPGAPPPTFTGGGGACPSCPPDPEVPEPVLPSGGGGGRDAGAAYEACKDRCWDNPYY
jgi:RHS repeat-associated protein